MAPGDRTTVPRWQRRPQARREEILDAAQEVFGECGFARAKLDDVARHAGVSKGTLYLYFDSKETLFREMVRARVVTVLANAEETLRDHTGSSRDLLAELMRRMWWTARQPAYAKLARLVQSELGSFPELAQFYVDEVILRVRRLFDAVLDRGIAAGEFRPEARRFTARVLPSLIVHSAQLQDLLAPLDAEALADNQIADGIVDLVFHGVLAHPDTNAQLRRCNDSPSSSRSS